MNQAEALFEISNCEIDWKSNPSVTLALGRVIKKMGLYDSEKKKLIIKYMFGGENSEVNNMLANKMLDLF